MAGVRSVSTEARAPSRPRQDVAAWLRTDFGRLLRAVGQVPEERRTAQLLDEWSVKDVVGHIAGWDAELALAIDQVLRGERPSYIDRSEDEMNVGFVASRRRLSFEQALAEARQNHERLVRRIEQISDDSWRRESGLRWPTRLPLTVSTIFDYTYRDQSHYAGHAAEIEELSRGQPQQRAVARQAVNLEDLEAIARERLDPKVYDYYAGGAEDEASVGENRAAFQRRFLKPRVLVDVTERDLTTDLIGTPLPFPIVLAPTALQRFAHRDGEVATARAAGSLGALFTVSTLSSASLESVAAAAPDSPRWFQLYCAKDRSVTESLVRRATAARYGALVVTVDVPFLGRRERDLRNVFALPPGAGFGNFSTPPPDPGPERSAVARWFGWIQTPAITWDDVAWLRTLTPLPLVLKGILRADDAKRAADAGVAAIWVSNHGGRQLDGAVPAVDALAEIRQAVPGTPLIVDGGVRRGTDVLKALALGATAVAIGRPQLWGLAADGQAGVRRVLELLRDELSLAMALAGCRSIGEIGSDLIA